jgi:hypothetical protein
MAGSDPVFLALFIFLFGALAIANFVQANEKQGGGPYQNLFGTVYFLGAVILMIFGFNAYKQSYSY